MKSTYTTPVCTMIAMENADVLTFSLMGEGERMAWNEGRVQ